MGYQRRVHGDSSIAIRMLRAIIVLTAVCAVLGEDSFVKKYGYSKVMANCFGEELYYEWAKGVFMAKKECKHEDGSAMEEEEEEDSAVANRFGNQPVFLVYNPQGQAQAQQFPFKFFAQRQKRDDHVPMYDAPLLKKMKMKVKAKVSNFTCVMKKMNYVDEDFNIKYDEAIEELKEFPISKALKDDMVEGVEHCREFIKCLPMDESPMPKKLKEIVAFIKCDKKARLGICMKHDLMKYLGEFDLSGSKLEDKEEGEVAEKLLHLLWGVEAKDDFELY